MSIDGSQGAELPAGLQMYQMIWGFIVSQGIYVAAKLGIADLIAKAPMTVMALANQTKSDPQALKRLLGLLASVGIFREGSDGTFEHTTLSLTLRSDAQPSMRDVALMLASKLFWGPWGDLFESVLNGEPAFDRIYGAPIFEYLMQHPEEAAIVSSGMTSGSSLDIAAVVAAYDFAKFKKIVDVGGSHGALLAGILTANLGVRGVLADLPPVVAGATLLKNSVVADRCEIAGIDFFAAVPEGGDAYILKWVIHDWNDEDAIKILQSCRRAIGSDGKLLLIEHVLKPTNEPDPGRFLDLGIIALAKGRERTEQEFREIFRAGGFSLQRIISTAGLLSILESTPA
jgi:hypothetical protein